MQRKIESKHVTVGNSESDGKNKEKKMKKTFIKNWDLKFGSGSPHYEIVKSIASIVLGAPLGVYTILPKVDFFADTSADGGKTFVGTTDFENVKTITVVKKATIDGHPHDLLRLKSRSGRVVYTYTDWFGSDALGELDKMAGVGKVFGFSA